MHPHVNVSAMLNSVFWLSASKRGAKSPEVATSGLGMVYSQPWCIVSFNLYFFMAVVNIQQQITSSGHSAYCCHCLAKVFFTLMYVFSVFFYFLNQNLCKCPKFVIQKTGVFKSCLCLLYCRPTPNTVVENAAVVLPFNWHDWVRNI